MTFPQVDKRTEPGISSPVQTDLLAGKRVLQIQAHSALSNFDRPEHSEGQGHPAMEVA